MTERAPHKSGWKRVSPHLCVESGPRLFPKEKMFLNGSFALCLKGGPPSSINNRVYVMQSKFYLPFLSEVDYESFENLSENISEAPQVNPPLTFTWIIQKPLTCGPTAARHSLPLMKCIKSLNSSETEGQSLAPSYIPLPLTHHLLQTPFFPYLSSLCPLPPQGLCTEAPRLSTAPLPACHLPSLASSFIPHS